MMFKQLRGKSENKKWHAGLTMKRAFDGANNEFGACLKIKEENTLICFDPVCTVFTWKGHIKCQAMINDATERTRIFHILPMILVLSQICVWTPSISSQGL